jgi:hypothetical protein
LAQLQLLTPQPKASARQAAGGVNAVSQVRDTLSDTVAARRRERDTLWQEAITPRPNSNVAPQLGPQTGTVNGRRDGAAANDIRNPPDDAGGIVIDTPVSPLRH